MMRRRAKSRGFATTMALMLVALVGSAILAVTMLSASDFRRTATEARDAQLRQLVLAAALDLRARARAGMPLENYELPLPSDMISRDGGGVSIRIESTDAPRRAIVTARFAGQKLIQEIPLDTTPKQDLK